MLTKPSPAQPCPHGHGTYRDLDGHVYCPTCEQISAGPCVICHGRGQYVGADGNNKLCICQQKRAA